MAHKEIIRNGKGQPVGLVSKKEKKVLQTLAIIYKKLCEKAKKTPTDEGFIEFVKMCEKGDESEWKKMLKDLEQ